jgi:TPR repeat protein
LDKLDSEGSQIIAFYKGTLLFRGDADDQKRAHDIFVASAAKGHAPSMIYLGEEDYIAGRYAAAFSWFQKALAGGQPDAYQVLALMYEGDQGIGADPGKAADYLLKFAKFQVPAPDLDDLVFVPDAATIEALQRRLADLGYYKGRIDGILGKGTREAYAAAGAFD